MEDINELRNIPKFWNSVGSERERPDSCSSSFEYKDIEQVKLDSSKFKGDFQSEFSFENCSITDSKIRWCNINYVRITDCKAVGSSFSQVEMAWGVGITGALSEKCKFKNVRLHNMRIVKSSISDGKFEKDHHSHIRLEDCDIIKVKTDDFGLSMVRMTNNRFSDVKATAAVIQILYSDNDTFKDLELRNARIKNCKFVNDTFDKVKISETKFKECYFKDIDFTNTEFENCTFSECLFDDCTYTEKQGELFGIKQ